jgi:DNA gyrase subunit A
MAHDSILFLTNLGIAYKLKVYNIPETQKQSKGKPIVNLLNLRENEKISFFVPAENFNEGYSLVVATKKGQIIKTSLINFANVRKGGLIAVKLREGDEVINAKIVDNSLKDTLITIATKFGKSICSDINDYRLLARGAMGVRGIKLLKGDEVVSMDILTSKDDFLVGITENGYGKKTTMTEFRKQNRGGSGLIAIKTGNRNGNVVAVLKVKENNDIILITSSGRIIRIKASNLRSIGRNTMGVRLIGLSEGEKVSNAIAALASNEGEEETAD